MNYPESSITSSLDVARTDPSLSPTQPRLRSGLFYGRGMKQAKTIYK